MSGPKIGKLTLGELQERADMLRDIIVNDAPHIWTERNQLAEALAEQAIAAFAFEKALREVVSAHAAWKRRPPPINGESDPAWTRMNEAWKGARAALRYYGKEGAPDSLRRNDDGSGG